MNYPKGIKVNQTTNINYANRGMTLEDDLNITNNYYLDHQIAVISKRPVPIQVTKVDYSDPHKKLIKEAYFMSPSTLDYCGVYKGNYLDFDAKETISKTSLPIKNIHAHQIKHIKNVLLHGGISFLIVRFVKLEETYLLLGKDLLNYIEYNSTKSIPYKYFKQYGYLVPLNYNPRVNYLKNIDLILEEKNEKRFK